MSAYYASFETLICDVDDNEILQVDTSNNHFPDHHHQTMLQSDTISPKDDLESNLSSWISDIRSLNDDFSLCNDHHLSLLQAADQISVATSKDEDNKKRRQRKNNKEHEAIEARGGDGCVVYVRARRGQATDSHSLAERVRRQKIGERMKLLQSLVPGCDKMVGKTLILDEIINYIHSLQTQVQFLQTRLALLDPMFNLSNHALDSVTTQQVVENSSCNGGLLCSTAPSEWSSLDEVYCAFAASSSSAPAASPCLSLLQDYGFTQ